MEYVNSSSFFKNGYPLDKFNRIFPLYFLDIPEAIANNSVLAFALQSSSIVLKVPLIKALSGTTFVAPKASKCPKLITLGTSSGVFLSIYSFALSINSDPMNNGFTVRSGSAPCPPKPFT